MSSLVEKLNRFKIKFSREFQTMMAAYRYGSFGRHYPRRTPMEKLGGRFNAEAALDERMLTDQLVLKDYGKITPDVKLEGFETVKTPQETNVQNATTEPLKKTDSDNK